MNNTKLSDNLRLIAANFDGLSQELQQVAGQLDYAERHNPQNQLVSLVRIAETSTVQLRNLTGRTITEDKSGFYHETADALGVRIEEYHSWIRITVPAILPKRNQRDNQAFLVRPLRQALLTFLTESPMERFSKCAICIVHRYDESLGIRRIRDYDNIETKRYLDVIESMLLTNDSGLLCTILQSTEISDRDSTDFYLMLPETLPKWTSEHLKMPTTFCSAPVSESGTKNA